MWARPGAQGDPEGMKKILCAVLPRTQLSWAVESRRLAFQRERTGAEYDSPASEQIRSVRAEHTADGARVTLGVPEQAEWLLCFKRCGREEDGRTPSGVEEYNVRDGEGRGV